MEINIRFETLRVERPGVDKQILVKSAKLMHSKLVHSAKQQCGSGQDETWEFEDLAGTDAFSKARVERGECNRNEYYE